MLPQLGLPVNLQAGRVFNSCPLLLYPVGVGKQNGIAGRETDQRSRVARCLRLQSQELDLATLVGHLTVL